MVVRRSRFQVRPNVAGRSTAATTPAAPATVAEPTVDQSVDETVESTDGNETAAVPQTQIVDVGGDTEPSGVKQKSNESHKSAPPNSAPKESETSVLKAPLVKPATPRPFSPPPSPKKRGSLAANAPLVAAALQSPAKLPPKYHNWGSPRSPRKHITDLDRPRPSTSTTPFEGFPQQPSKFSEAQLNKQFSGHEVMDPKTFRMADLVFWNPRPADGDASNETDESGGVKVLTRRGRRRVRAVHEESGGGDDASSENTAGGSDTSSLADMKPNNTQWNGPCPQVKTDSFGRIIIDEESLTVRQPGEVESKRFAMLDHGSKEKRLSSFSFRRKAFCRSSCPWTVDETDRFYKILMATGPDFTMMHEFFPTRSRDQLLRKYKSECKTNKKRIDDAMRMPGVLDQSLYQLIPKDSRAEYRDNEPIPVEVIGDGAVDPYTLDLQEEARREIEAIEAAVTADPISKQGRKRRLASQFAEAIPDGLLADLRPTHTRALQPAVKQMIEEIKRAVHINVEPVEPMSHQKRFAPYGAEHDPSIPEVSIVPNTAGGRPVLNLPAGSTFQFLRTNEGEPRQLLVSAPIPAGGGRRREFVLVHQRAADNETGSDLIHFYVVTRPGGDDDGGGGASNAPATAAAFPPVVPHDKLPRIQHGDDDEPIDVEADDDADGILATTGQLVSDVMNSI